MLTQSPFDLFPHRPIPESWDTAPDERLFLGTALNLFDGLGTRNLDQLGQLLAFGVDAGWFQNLNLRAIYEALIETYLETSTRDGVTVRLSHLIRTVEQRCPGETSWVRAAVTDCTQTADIIDVQALRDEVIPLWWQKIKRSQVRQILGAIDTDLTLRAPDRQVLATIAPRLQEAADRWEDQPPSQAMGIGLFDSIRERVLQPRPVGCYIPTGLKGVDNYLGGGLAGAEAPDRGRLIVLCGRPGMGKTALAVSLSMALCLGDSPVGFWSLEMQDEQIAMRMMAAYDLHLTGWEPGQPFVASEHLTYNDLRYHFWPSQAVLDRFCTTDFSPLQERLAVFGGGSHLTPEAVATQMRLFCRSHPGCRLLVVDHLGLLQINDSNRAIGVGEATRLLKTTATELGIDVLLLAQLSRALEQRSNKIPTLTDLRDSGRIEEDADVVIGLHRPAYYDPNCNPQHLDVAILKNRQGACGLFTATAMLDCCAILN